MDTDWCYCGPFDFHMKLLDKMLVNGNEIDFKTASINLSLIQTDGYPKGKSYINLYTGVNLISDFDDLSYLNLLIGLNYHFRFNKTKIKIIKITIEKLFFQMKTFNYISKLVIPLILNYILTCNLMRWSGGTDSFDLFAFKNSNGDWGYLNSEGEIVINNQFEEANPFYDGRARVVIENSDGKDVFVLSTLTASMITVKHGT